MVPFKTVGDCRRLSCLHGEIVDITSQMEPFELDDNLGCLYTSSQAKTWNQAKEKCMEHKSVLLDLAGTPDLWKNYATNKSIMKHNY